MRATPSFAVYVINLDRSPLRWAAIQTNFPELADRITRVPALDAARAPDSVLAVRGLTLGQPPNGIGWNPLHDRSYALIEEACFASHLLALRLFLATDRTHAVMLEDDVVPLRPPREEIEEIIAGDDFDLLKIEGLKKDGRRLAIPERQLARARLVRSLRPASGSAGYVVSRGGAEKLIANAGQRLVPFDDYLQNPGFHGCRTLHLSPWLVIQAEGESVITAERASARSRRRRGPRLLPPLRRARLRLQQWRWALAGWRPFFRSFDLADW